jgi:hypothetical protein
MAPTTILGWSVMSKAEKPTLVDLIFPPESKRKPTLAADGPGPHMTLRAAGVAIGVHENTIRNWIEKGKLPAFKIPRPEGSLNREPFWRLRRVDVEAFIAERRRKSEGPLFCVDCGRAETPILAERRVFNRGRCGNCGGELR